MTGIRRWPRLVALAPALYLAGVLPAAAQSGGQSPIIGMPGGGCDSDFAARRGARDTTALVEPRGGCDGIMHRDEDAPQTRGARPKPRPSEPTGAGRAPAKPQPADRSR